ncbi:hypothetical protein Leryth_017537 [Lithospermum erythrorhizon]|nr:hypothetical protein Leryth_017537 [Lithospermum erythrorhizon]
MALKFLKLVSFMVFIFFLTTFHLYPQIRWSSTTITIFTPKSQIDHQHHYQQSRKILLANKFDFTTFMHHHNNRRDDPFESEIDPRYGVDKRLVPSGPNPLHH